MQVEVYYLFILPTSTIKSWIVLDILYITSTRYEKVDTFKHRSLPTLTQGISIPCSTPLLPVIQRGYPNGSMSGERILCGTCGRLPHAVGCPELKKRKLIVPDGRGEDVD